MKNFFKVSLKMSVYFKKCKFFRVCHSGPVHHPPREYHPNLLIQKKFVKFALIRANSWISFLCILRRPTSLRRGHGASGGGQQELSQTPQFVLDVPDSVFPFPGQFQLIISWLQAMASVPWPCAACIFNPLVEEP